MMTIVQIFLWLSFITIGAQCQSLKGSNLIVTSVLDAPYTMLRNSHSNHTGNDRYEGYIVDLLDAISSLLEFNYTLKINDDGFFGAFDRTAGKWTGMIGEIMEGRSHIAAGGLTITAERESVVDFTQPFMNLGIGVLYLNRHIFIERKSIDDFMDLLYPLLNSAAATFLLLALFFGIILLILRRKHKTIIFRILLGLWLLCLVIFLSQYIAKLSSQSVITGLDVKQHREIESIEALDWNDSVTYGCIRGGSTERFFRNSEYPLYKKMWSRMQDNLSTFVSNNAEGVERVTNGDYAFFAESTVIEYATARNCDLYQIGGLLDSKGFGLAVRQGASIRQSLNQAILKLQEDGVLTQLKKAWWITEKLC